MCINEACLRYGAISTKYDIYIARLEILSPFLDFLTGTQQVRLSLM